MNVIGLFLQVGILWFLITLFTGSTSSSRSLTETWIVVIGMLIVSFLVRLLLGGILGPFTFVIEIAALYLLVDKVCGTRRNVTIRICAWYLGISFLFSLFFAMISRW
ncbi:hypothetical protein OKA04_02890 [Luteolibacter flavescens]|uniref:Uncharacterized protein n=1 Tax=Luteolibacter flavescens TaxID=1859460 RepID=A0ABT3FJC4_9BACT|nr:hypothetical protein [Luteolibacter flavescens]MCW1883658.1 hypothetical protein [Luteolibacter flavescens]